MAQPQDEVVWQIINHGHCSFKAKADRQNFCRNEHNVTGLCNRSSCPLANSRYATIREDNGRLYLCIKTIERAHTPKHLWQKIRLSRNYLKALGQVSDHLAHWPKFLVHKNKQRLTKITQYLIRMRKLALKPRTALVTEPTRVKKQERRKEAKALKAAQLESAIEKELLTRLQSSTYGDIYNFPMTQYNRVLDRETVPDGEEETARKGRTTAAEEDEEEEEEQEEEAFSDSDEEIEYVEDLEESEDDLEDLAANWGYGGASDSSGGDSDGGDSDGGSDDAGGSSGSGEGSSDGEGGAQTTRRPGSRRSGAAAAAKRAPPKRKRGRREYEIEEERETGRLRR